MTRRDWWILLALTGLGALLRFYQLGVVPPGPQFDEAFNAIDAQQVLAGNRPLFLPANGGREVLYTYYQATIGALLGLNLYTLRLASAVAGVLTVPAVYLLVRRLFERDSRLLAILTALVLAISYWHIHFSHYGIRIILMPLLLSGVFGFFWLGLDGGSRRVRVTALVLSGVLMGLGVWNNPTGRVAPFVVLLYVLWLLWRFPQRRKLAVDSPIGGLLLSGVVAFLIFLPLGVEFVRHPDFFFGHASEVSVFAERVSGEASPWSLLGINVLRILGMFGFDGDKEWAHGIADRPVFDWFMAVAFYGGVVVWFWRLIGRDRPQPDPDRNALFLFAAWGVVMLAPSVLSEAAPNYSRTLAAVPPVMLGAGLGLSWLATRARLQPWAGPVLVGVIVGASLIVTFFDYFVRLPRFPEVYYVYDADKVDGLDWMKAQVENNYTVYLSPLWSTHATVTFLRNSQIRSLDTTQAVVLPEPGKGAIYAFPAEQRDLAEEVARLWETTVETVYDRFDRPLLEVVRINPLQAAEWPPGYAPEEMAPARFDDGPSLIGMKVAESSRALYLYWQAEQRTLRDLTSFVHLLDSHNRRIAQADVVPGDGTYWTPAWRPGERVIQRYVPEIIEPCGDVEPVRVVTGWYEYAAGGQRRPRLDAPGDTALAGEMVLPLHSVPRDSVTPANLQDIPLSPSLTQIGYTLDAGVAEPGAPFTLDLYLLGDEHDGATPLSLSMVSEAGRVELWEGELAPNAVWRIGEIVCRRLYLRVPSDQAPGEYALHLKSRDGERAFATLTVEPSTRTFVEPTTQVTVDAALGDELKLIGYDLERTADAVTARLVWQAVAPPTLDAKVFVHLLDARGSIVTQSDSVPAGGHNTNRWVAGEIVVDEHRLVLPPELHDAELSLVAGMYDPATGLRLPAFNREGEPFPDNAIPLGAVSAP